MPDDITDDGRSQRLEFEDLMSMLLRDKLYSELNRTKAYLALVVAWSDISKPGCPPSL